MVSPLGGRTRDRREIQETQEYQKERRGRERGRDEDLLKLEMIGTGERSNSAKIAVQRDRRDVAKAREKGEELNRHM